MHTGHKHVASVDFGEGVDTDKEIADLIEKAPKLKSVSAQMVLRDRYETAFGIYNHEDPNADHPFALILQHWNEDPVSGGLLHERMAQFLDLEIFKYFGLNFQEFIDQPPYVVTMMMEVAKSRLSKDATAAGNMSAQLAALTGNNPKVK